MYNYFFWVIDERSVRVTLLEKLELSVVCTGWSVIVLGVAGTMYLELLMILGDVKSSRLMSRLLIEVWTASSSNSSVSSSRMYFRATVSLFTDFPGRRTVRASELTAKTILGSDQIPRFYIPLGEWYCTISQKGTGASVVYFYSRISASFRLAWRLLFESTIPFGIPTGGDFTTVLVYHFFISKDDMISFP